MAWCLWDIQESIPMKHPDPATVIQNVTAALEEDIQQGDITAALIPEMQQATATLRTREAMLLCGQPWVEQSFLQIDPTITLDWHYSEGRWVEADQVLLTLQGNARALLTAERTAMNFFQTLSAVATATHHYSQLLAPYPTQILDTRKTLPGLRIAQKYAVACGGGTNHRMGLYDAYLIKENHIAACGSIEAAVKAARAQHPDYPVEVEVENLDELQQALDAGSDTIMLDNFTLAQMEAAVVLTQGRAKLEVSGNVTAEQLTTIAATGVDYISTGALTKHIQAIDLSLRIETVVAP